MALVPVIQPPIMKALTTEKERQIVMRPLREVSKKEKIFFPVVVTVFVALLVPSAAPLIACLMLGNLARECGVLDRLSKTMQNELMNIVTIFLGVSAVPMAARVSQKVGQQYNPGNFLLMHAMGPNVAGVIGSAIAAGVLISLFG